MAFTFKYENSASKVYSVEQKAAEFKAKKNRLPRRDLALLRQIHKAESDRLAASKNTDKPIVPPRPHPERYPSRVVKIDPRVYMEDRITP